MKSIRTKAIVLRRTDYGEADRIVQFITPENGIMSAMAKAVRKEKSRLAGGIELFARCDVTIGSGKGELGIVTAARLDKFYGNIMTDYDHLQLGYEAIKQVSKAASAVEESAFFDLLEQMFVCLNDLSIDSRLSEAWFWLQLAILLGVGLNLETDIDGARLEQGETYAFLPSDHGFSRNKKGPFTSDHIKLLRILSAQPPKVAAHVRGVSALITDVVWVARQAVAH